jgi:hypothetical protein
MRFYRHMYDHSGNELAPKELPRRRRRNVSIDIVLTDQEWRATANVRSPTNVALFSQFRHD